MKKTDVVIIGSGPVGLFAIFQCGMLKLSCHIFDTLDRVGGQCSALYPEKPIYDIPAHPEISGDQLTQNLLKQASPFNPQFHLNEQVTHIEQINNNKWLVKGSKGTEIQCCCILIAAGVGAFGPNRPPLKNIEQFEGSSIHYYVNNRSFYKGKNLVIAGGGDSAVDWAINLASIAKKVYVVHRRLKFRAAPESENKLHELAKKNDIELVCPYQLSGIMGENKQITSVQVKNLDGHEKSLQADILLPFFGLSMNLGPINEWGLGMEKQYIRINPLTGATNKPGAFAIGDIATYPHKLKLILTGFSEAAQAAHAIRKFIYHNEEMHFEHSTTKGVKPIKN